VNDTAVDSGGQSSASAMVEQNSCGNAEQEGRKRGRGVESNAGFAFSLQPQRTKDVIDLCDSPSSKRARSKAVLAVSSLPHRTNDVVDLCDSPPSKFSFYEVSTKREQQASRRQVLKAARKRTEWFCEMMEAPSQDIEASLLLHLRTAVTWAVSQRGVPTEQQNAAAGDNKQTMAAWVISPQRARPIVNV